LPDAVAADLGRRLGADLGAVQVHTDTQADGFNRTVWAAAFTTGRDIFFRRGGYDASAPTGLQRRSVRRLVAVKGCVDQSRKRSSGKGSVTPRQPEQEPRLADRVAIPWTVTVAAGCSRRVISAS
jgi:hypothetical protein